MGKVFIRDKNDGYYRAGEVTNRKPHFLLLHRYVVRESGFPLTDEWEVHHRDFNKNNNLLTNLLPLKKEEHRRMHYEITSTRSQKGDTSTSLEEYYKTEDGRKELDALYERYKEASMNGREVCYCKHCGKSFDSSKHGLFCSNKCKAAHRRAIGADNETRICKECGKTFTVNRYKKTEFCSGTCASTYNGKIRHDKYVKGLADGTIQSPVVEAVCPICGETFTKKRWESKKVCSPECRIMYTAQKQTGRSNVITKTFRHVCEVCGCEYENHSAHSTVCSTRCKQRKAAAKGRRMVEAVCAVCGAKFMHSKYNNSQTCSRKCRMVLIAKNYLGKAGVKVGDLKSASAPVGNSSH